MQFLTWQVTDSAKKYMYEQRKNAALATASHVKGWEAERRGNKLKFREDAAKNKDMSKKIESSARSSRKQLQEQRQRQADAVREHKKHVLNSYRMQQEDRAALVKQVVNATVAEKFASPANSRRMLQHPHFQEVCASPPNGDPVRLPLHPLTVASTHRCVRLPLHPIAPLLRRSPPL